MGREVRRVPVNWKHPLEYNPHWEAQAAMPYGRSKPLSWLHAPDERFTPLMDDYPGRLAGWQQELRDLRAREGHSWTFAVEYYLTGFKGRDDAETKVHPFHGWSAGGREAPITVRDEDHLYELLLNEKLEEKPDPKDYMPVFEEPEEELGWCLYEDVSEGTPVTPVFETAEALIEHLCIIGQDHDQVPMRRASAEALVRTGWAPSMMIVGNTLLKGDEDADKIAALSNEPPVERQGMEW